MTTTTSIAEQIEEMKDHLASMREHALTNGDGELGRVCAMDGYPTPMRCTCDHGHNRHSGKPDETRCLSYVGQPECNCTEFVPMSDDVAALWEAYARLLRAIDIQKIVDRVPIPRASLYVRDWPLDEQELWDSRRGTDPDEALFAVDLLRRQKAALSIVTALVGAP